MVDKVLPIKCELVESNVEVGAGKCDTNTVVLKVTNTSTSADAISFTGPGARGEFSIAIAIGREAKNLIATSEEASAISIQAPVKWQPLPYKNLAGQATWSYRLPNPVLAGGEGALIKLTKFESKTDPGEAELTIKVKTSGYADYEATLKAEKKAKEFDLLYFTADPPYVITEQDKTNLTLTWNAVKAGEATLYGLNNEVLKRWEGKDFKSGKPLNYEPPARTSFLTTYKLVVTDEANKKNTKAQPLQVPVLSGWENVAFSSFGYPAVMCSMNGVILYGIFIKKGKAGLYESKYPFAGWTLVNSDVPDGMETSPAVCLGNKLWLIGGSVANPEVRNNKVWAYDYEAGEWKEHKAAHWTPRMGHQCVTSGEDRLWVLGGNDETGTSLNEIWTAKIKGGELTWTRSPDAPWPPRCMFAATVETKNTGTGKDENTIWIYGGVTAPFSDPLEDMWSSKDEGPWEQYKNTPMDVEQGKQIPIGKPLGSTLQVIGGELNLIGSFRKGTIVTPRIAILNRLQQTWVCREVTKPWHRQGDQTFSLLSVQHRGLLFLRSLDYQTFDNPTKLYMYVPEP